MEAIQPRDVQYFESHITVEPVFDERLELFQETVKPFGFKAADLLLQKSREATPERSSKDTFATAKAPWNRRADIENRMRACVAALQFAGFKVWRYKIEAVVLDVKLAR